MQSLQQRAARGLAPAAAAPQAGRRVARVVKARSSSSSSSSSSSRADALRELAAVQSGLRANLSRAEADISSRKSVVAKAEATVRGARERVGGGGAAGSGVAGGGGGGG